MKPRYLQELIRNLQAFYKCPSCDTSYVFDDIRFLGELESYCFMQLSCHNCSLPVLATVTVNAQPEQETRRTDLQQGEAAQFTAKGAISASEIAEFHRWLSRSKRLS